MQSDAKQLRSAVPAAAEFRANGRSQFDAATALSDIASLRVPSKPLRILHYLPVFRYEQGGPIRAVTDLSQAFLRLGHDVTVATSDATDWPAEWLDAPAGSKVVRLLKLPEPAMPGGFFSPPQLKEIEPLLDGFDVLHLHLVWVSSNAQLAALARARNMPYVVSLRGTLDDWSMSRGTIKKRVFLALTGRDMLEKAATVHCTARLESEQSFKWFPRGNATVIPNLMDLEPFRKLPGPELARQKFGIPDDGTPLLLFLSRIQEKKGVEVLLRAAKILRERGVRFRLAIAGTGAQEYVERNRALKRDLQLQESVMFVGHVGGQEKYSLYEAADLFVLPTSQENFGFVFFESLAAGTPVVTTPLVDTAEDLVASGGAVLAEQNPEAFADAIARLLADPLTLAQMSKRGREWTFRELDPVRIVREFERMYASLA